MRLVMRASADGIRVPIFGIAKTITDLFRYRRTVGINLALEGLREAMRKRKITPAAVAPSVPSRRRVEDDGTVFDHSDVQWLSRWQIAWNTTSPSAENRLTVSQQALRRASSFSGDI